MAEIILFLKSLSGKTTTVKVPAACRVGFVKACLQDKEGIPPAQVAFSFGTTDLLDDDATIDKVGLKNESTLNWKLRLSGGPAPAAPAKVAAGPYPFRKPTGPLPSRPLISNSEALKRVVGWYSANEALSYKELCVFAAGFFVISLPNRPARNNAIVKALSKETIQRQHNFEGSVLKGDLVKFLLDEAARSDDDKEKLRLGLLRHGFALSNNVDQCYEQETPHTAGEVIDYDWLWLHELQGKSGVKMNDFTMEVGNSMHRFHQCPSEKVLALLDDSQRNQWKMNVKRWEEEDDAERLAATLYSGKETLSETGRQVLLEVFKRFDADGDGALNMTESATACFFIRDSFYLDWERAVPVSFDKFCTFFIKEGYDQTALKKYLRTLGADEKCIVASFKWPADLTLSAYLLSKLKSSPPSALHTIKSLADKLTIPKDVVDKLRELVPTVQGADLLLLSLTYRDGTQAEIADAAQAMKVLQAALSYLDWGVLTVLGQKYAEPAHIVRLDEQLAAFVLSHPGALEESIEAIRLTADGTLPAPGPSILGRLGVAEAQEGKYPDFLFRTTRSMLSTSPRLALWALDIVLPKSKVHPPSFKLVKSAVDLNPSYLNVVLDRVKNVPHVHDWIKAFCKNEPLCDVLQSDKQLAECTSIEVSMQLSSYLQIEQGQLNAHFAAHGICKSALDPIADHIIADAKKLVKLGVQRHVLADLMDALLAWAHFQETHNIVAQPMTGEITATRQAAHNRLKESLAKYRAIVQEKLHFDPSDAAAVEKFPLVIVRCSTMGHHNDVFHWHPACSMQSYYLPGTGGSSEVVIINKSLIAAGREAEWSQQAVAKKLSERLNSKVAHAWENDPAVVYCSDMHPYLIRTACCFEAPGVRYRVDPEKLVSVLKPILKQ